MSSHHSIHAQPQVSGFRRQRHAVLTVAAILSCLVAADRLQAAIVYFPVSSGGSISQSGTGGPQVLLAFGDINLITGTFTIGTDNVNAPSFGLGLKPPEAPAASQFFAQTNDGVAWLLSSSTIALLSAGGTVGTGSYTSNDPNFGGDWKAGVSPGYAGLQMTSGSDTFYGWASITYVVGSPNQVTVNSFAFENQPNTPITVAAVPEPGTTLAVGACTVGLAAIMLRRRMPHTSQT